jgi:hypothetical protein
MRHLWLTLIGTLMAASIALGEDHSTSQESRFVRIGHFQCECEQGDFEANVQTLLRGLQQA